MRCGFFSSQKRFMRKEHGGVAVEFAIIVPVLLLLVFGIIDFGHAWFMKHVLQNSCREGARYATRYQTKTDGTGDRVLPKDLTPSIQNYILNTGGQNGGAGTGLSSLLPADADAQVTPSGPAFTETDITKLPLEDLTVTVTAKKYWFILNKLVPGITSDHVNITVAATMKCE
jgi:Flp pilus assembly protein TadG